MARLSGVATAAHVDGVISVTTVMTLSSPAVMLYVPLALPILTLALSRVMSGASSHGRRRYARRRQRICWARHGGSTNCATESEF